MRVGLHPVLREPKGLETGREGEESERKGKGRREEQKRGSRKEGRKDL